jgi:hypothetical protein
MTRRVYLREIYLYMVCIIAIIVFIIGIITTYDGLINYIKPSTWVSKPDIITMYSEQYQDLSSKEIEQLAEEQVNNSIRNEKDMALKDMIRGLLLLVISIPLFIFHWKKAQVMWGMHIEEKDHD